MTTILQVLTYTNVALTIICLGCVVYVTTQSK